VLRWHTKAMQHECCFKRCQHGTFPSKKSRHEQSSNAAPPQPPLHKTLAYNHFHAPRASGPVTAELGDPPVTDAGGAGAGAVGACARMPPER